MTILVAYTARPEGEAALEKAIEISTRRCERLYVVNAAPGGQEDDPDIVPSYEVERLEARLQALRTPATFKQFVRGKTIVQELEELIATQDVSLVVIGLRRRSSVGKLLLGSMAQDILMTLECPILSVKAS